MPVFQQPAVIAGVQQKESSLERMGMEGIIHDMRASKQRLLAKYTEAHAAAQHHLSDVAAVHAAVDEVCSPQEPATMAAPHARFVNKPYSTGAPKISLWSLFATYTV